MMVDIIIPTFNRCSVLDRAIKSVFHQTFKNYILWVVDDGSTDNTLSILQKWQSIFPPSSMRVIHLPKRRGVSVARNKGIQAGKAYWLAFLDSDDEWKSDKLSTQMQWIKNNPSHYLVHTDEIWIRNGTKLNPKKKHKKKGGRVFIDNLELCRISPSSVIINRSFFNKIGLFKENFLVCEDYELWLRVCSRIEVGFIKTPLLIKYGGHADQLSKKYKAMDEWRVRAMATHLNNPYLTKEEKKQLIFVLQKKCSILLNGYKKHNNYKNMEEIKSIYRSSTSTGISPRLWRS